MKESVGVTIRPMKYSALVRFLFLKGKIPQNILEETMTVYTDVPKVMT